MTGMRTALEAVGLWLVALAARLIGISWGYPHGDEAVSRAFRLLAGDLSIAEMFYPPLINYINAISLGVYYVVCRLLGVYDGIADVEVQWVTDPMAFSLVVRLAVSMGVALLAPSVYLAGIFMGHRRLNAMMVALLVGLVPVSVWFSHIAKPQNYLTLCVVGALASAVAYLRRPGDLRPAIALGLFAGLAQSFLHSAFVFLSPIAAATLFFGLTDHRVNRSVVLRQAGVAAAVALVVWVVLSIQILFQFREFVEWQGIQTQTRFGARTIDAFLGHTLPTFASQVYGFGPLGLMFVPAALALGRDRVLVALAAGMAAVAAFLAWSMGDKLVPWLILPVPVSLTLLAGWSLTGVIERSDRPNRQSWAAYGMLAVLAGGQLVGVLEVYRQALIPPPTAQVAALLQDIGDPNTSRILAGEPSKTGLTTNLQAVLDDRARQERLAKKYGLVLNESDRGIEIRKRQRSGWYIRAMPWSIVAQEGEVEGEVVVKPYMWPVQPEEWTLDHWLDQAFDIFIVPEDMLEDKRVKPHVKAFVAEVVERCQRAGQFKEDRPLFAVGATSVFHRCRASNTAGEANRSADSEES